MGIVTNDNYDIANEQLQKEPILVLEIEDAPFLFTSNKIYTKIRYDDPGVYYDGTYVYDGLRPVDENVQRSYIDRKGSSSTISQKLEQWDGKASIETFNIKLIDYNKEITKLCSPGQILDDILNKKVKIYFGYATLSYPEDYIKIFQGYINNVKISQGSVFFTFTDPSSKRRQTLFNGSTTRLTRTISFQDTVDFDYYYDLVMLNSNPFKNGEMVTFDAINGSLPSPLAVSTQYYVINATQDYFQISLTSGGPAIDIVDPGPLPQTPTYYVYSTEDDYLDVTSTDNLYRTITNALGANDDTVTIGLVLDGKEIVTYTNADIISTTRVRVNRGQFNTEMVEQKEGIEIKAFISLNDNPINIALKSQLSGWNGAWKENIDLRGIINTDNGDLLANTITFNNTVDLIRDYGLIQGDFVILSGSLNPSNNGVFTIADFTNDNRSVIVEQTGILVQENPPISGFLTTKAAFRSKYDVYPVTAGLGLDPDDVLVSQFEYLLNTFIKFNYTMNIIGAENSGKTWIEQNLLKPIGGYSLTQGSRISMGLTHPPLANDLTKFLTPDNIINAKSIEVERGLNTRFFYNEILFNYDHDPIQDSFVRSLRVLDADAQDRVRQVSVLSVDVKGLPDETLSETIMNQRAERILQRYRFSAETVSLEANFSVGHTIDAGDTIILKDTDPPVLNIANTETGARGISARVMEVQERTIDLSNGKTRVKLLSNNGFSLTDRYGVISPSSQIDASFTNTNSTIKIVPSFGAMFGAAEYRKWKPYVGYWIKVHNTDYTDVAVCTYTQDETDPNIMYLTPALPFVPNGNYYIEFEDYYEADVNRNDLIKATFAHLDSAATIYSGSSTNVFILDSGFSSRYLVGSVIYVQSPDGSRFSDDVKILSIVGDIVTIGGIYPASGPQDLGFVPQAGDIMQLGGFKDGGASYRFI